MKLLSIAKLQYNVGYEIIYLFPNLNGSTVEA